MTRNQSTHGAHRAPSSRRSSPFPDDGRHCPDAPREEAMTDKRAVWKLAVLLILLGIVGSAVMTGAARAEEELELEPDGRLVQHATTIETEAARALAERHRP